MRTTIDARTVERTVMKHEEIAVLCTYSILFTNDVCCGQMVDCFHAMKRTPYYKQAYKRYLNGADKARREYEREVNDVMQKHGEFFADCNDKYTEDVERHVEMLYWQFKQVLDKAGVEHSAELARFETARALCEYACLLFDERTGELISENPIFRRFKIGYLRLTNVARLMNLACDSLDAFKTVDMNTQRCRTAFRALANKLTDADIITDAVKSGTEMEEEKGN